MVPCIPPPAAFAARRFSGIIKVVCAAVCASLVSFSPARAAGANGDYKFVSASGSLTLAGETVQLNDDLLKQFGGLKNGKISIVENRLQINRKAVGKLINQLENELGIGIDASITGPTYVQLQKNGTVYTGATAKPVVLKFSTTFEGQKISGTIKFNFKVKVKGRDLTLNVPISGSALGYKLGGNVTVHCRK